MTVQESKLPLTPCLAAASVECILHWDYDQRPSVTLSPTHTHTLTEERGWPHR